MNFFYIAITPWLFSYFLAFYFIARGKILLFSNTTVFLFFSLLYSLIPLLVSYGYYPKTVWTLSLSDKSDLVQLHILIVGLSNLAFIAGMLVCSKLIKPSKRLIKDKFRVYSFDKLLVLVYFVISVIIAYYGNKYKWLSEGRSELINSFIGQGKVFLSGIYIYFIAVYGIRRLTLAMFASMLIITIIEVSRTTLIAMTIGTLVFAYDQYKISPYKLISIAIAFFSLFVYVALYRINFIVGKVAFFDLLYPVYIEGMYGSYMCLQVFDAVNKGIDNFTFFVNYLIDPIVFLIPRVVFDLLNENKDNFTIFGQWIDNANKVLAEPFAPYGSFFYTAEASASLPYIGPILIAFIYSLFLHSIEQFRNSSYIGRLNYLVVTIGFSMVFIKHTFAGSSHFLFITAVTAYAIYVISGLIRHLYNK
jgi:hypothetical protein